MTHFSSTKCSIAFQFKALCSIVRKSAIQIILQLLTHLSHWLGLLCDHFSIGSYHSGDSIVGYRDNIQYMDKTYWFLLQVWSRLRSFVRPGNSWALILRWKSVTRPLRIWPRASISTRTVASISTSSWRPSGWWTSPHTRGSLKQEPWLHQFRCSWWPAAYKPPNTVLGRLVHLEAHF